MYVIFCIFRFSGKTLHLFVGQEQETPSRALRHNNTHAHKSGGEKSDWKQSENQDLCW